MGILTKIFGSYSDKELKRIRPIADKVLVSTALIIALVPPAGVTLLWGYSSIAVAVILARELIISGFRMIASGKGMVISADKSGKIKTFFTDVAILVMLVAGNITPASFDLLNIIATVLIFISAGLTIYSGIECFVKNRAVLGENK